MNYILYKDCHIINGDKNVPLIHNGVIITNSDGLIEYIGLEANMPSLNFDRVINLNHQYVMPGLINAHAHFFNSGKPINNFDDIWIKLATWFLTLWPGKLYLKLVYKKNLRDTVNAGITTVRDVGSLYFNDVRCRNYFNKMAKGKPTQRQIGPRILASGNLITATGGHGYLYPDKAIANDPWADRNAVRKTLTHVVDWIKICNTEGISDATFIGEAGKVSMTSEEITALCDEAHSRNKMVATHCESTEGLRRALLAGVDTVEHGSIITDDLIPLFKNNTKALRGYTSLVPTLSAFFIPDLEHKLKPTEENHIIIENTKLIGEQVKKGFLTALANQIAIGVGNDASIPRVTHYDLYKELLYMQSFSQLSNVELIHMATVDTAKIIGLDSIVGSLDQGKSADFIVLRDNPLQDLNNLYKPRHVVIRGHMILKPKFKTFKDV